MVVGMIVVVALVAVMEGKGQRRGQAFSSGGEFWVGVSRVSIGGCRRV